ncbi:hypothetical protein ACFO3U_09175 [Flavobacterium ponti]|uniref:GLPGLI family protein n=1 Tax=Flavobacterium ponti TaxID=665133 RepID=A0ABV9P3F8_9FLAO
MNRIVALFLINVFMCANTSIGQLLKVPNLIEHYKEHKDDLTNYSSSFTQFLKFHYSKNTENNEKEHQDLPFKTFDNTVNHLFTLTTLNFQLLYKKATFKVKKSFFYKNSFKSNLFTSFWLPPKLV